MKDDNFSFLKKKKRQNWKLTVPAEMLLIVVDNHDARET